MIALGTVITVAGLNVFLVPAQIAAGGVSGLATLLYYVAKIPISATILALNIPLFLMGFRSIGREFFAKSLFATLLFSLFAELIPLPAITAEPFLCVIYGGVLEGIGIGLVIRYGGSTGGSDLAAILLNKKIKTIGVPIFVLLVDFLVIVASGVVFEPTSALYALATVFIVTKLIEFITEGISRAQAFFIITQKAEIIGQFITEALSRGATSIAAQGMYTKVEKHIILCVLPRSAQQIKLRQGIKELDPNAFVISTTVKEAFGQGFSEL